MKYVNLLGAVALWLAMPLLAQGQTAGFDNLNLPENGFWNGASGAPTQAGTTVSTFESGNASFTNRYYVADYGGYLAAWWTGFAYSNTTDITTNDYANESSAFAKGGAAYSPNYGVFYNTAPDTVVFDQSQTISGVYLTNSTYAALTIRDGSFSSKPFGGTSGNDPDYFKLTIEGLNQNLQTTSETEFYLADYRFTDNSKDYIVSEWTWVDLSELGEIKKLVFRLESSDNDPAYGMNTPAYFCLDELNGTPPLHLEDLDLEPESFWNGSQNPTAGSFQSGYASFSNYFSDEWGMDYWDGFAYTNTTNLSPADYTNYTAYVPSPGGVNKSQNYAIAYDGSAFMGPGHVPSVVFQNDTTLTGAYLANSVYAFDYFENEYETGDYFMLSIKPTAIGGKPQNDSICFYLADFRDSSNPYILDRWTWCDLSSLGKVSGLEFKIYTSDNFSPAYFCLDNLNGTPPALRVSAGAEQEIDPGQTATLSATSQGGFGAQALHSYSWQPAQSLDNPNSASPVANPDETTVYTVNVSDESGKTSMAQVKVEVDLPPHTIRDLDPVQVNMNAPNDTISLAALFTDPNPEDPDEAIVLRIDSVAPDGIVQATIFQHDSVVLCYTPDTYGSAVVTISAESDGKTTDYQWDVNVINTSALSETPAAVFRIYPNPAKNILYASLPQSGFCLKIFDMQGRVVFQKKALSQNEIFDLTDLKKGFYVLRFSKTSQIFHQKLIKQ